MRKFLFPLMVVLAGIMISGSTCTPDCCVPGTTLITAVSPTSFTFDWDDTTPCVVTVTVFTPIPPIPEVTWQVSAPAGWNVVPAGIITGSGSFTILPDVNYTGAEKKGTITITTANGDKATVAVTQEGMPVSDFVADNLDDISNDFYNQGPLTLSHGMGPGNALAMTKNDPFYTLVMGGLTDDPTAVTLNGVALTSTPPMVMSIGLNYFVSFNQYLYDNGELYVATAILAVEAADAGNNIQLGVDGVNYNIVVDAPTGTVDIVGAGSLFAEPATVSYTAPGPITYTVTGGLRQTGLYIDYDHTIPLTSASAVMIITKRTRTGKVNGGVATTDVIYGVTNLDNIDPATNADPGVTGRYGLGLYVFGYDDDLTDSAAGTTSWERVIEYTNYLIDYGVAKVRIEATWEP